MSDIYSVARSVFFVDSYIFKMFSLYASSFFLPNDDGEILFSCIAPSQMLSLNLVILFSEASITSSLMLCFLMLVAEASAMSS